MGHLKVISLDKSNVLECERLRCHPDNLGMGELRQIRPRGFFSYYDLLSEEHHHWGVTDGSTLLGMVSLAVARSAPYTIVLLTDFFSHPVSRQRLSSRKLIERVHEFIESLAGPVVLLAIESRYRLLDPLLAIAERLNFVFKAEQVLQSVAIPCASATCGPAPEKLRNCKLSELSESRRENLAQFLKADLSWPPSVELLKRIVKIDPDAQLFSDDGERDSSWAILFSERAYRAYEAHTHMNVIASDDRLISAGADWARSQGCDWLLMREPFPRFSIDSWPGRLNFSNRVMVGFSESDRNKLEPLGAARLFQGLTL